MKSRASRLGFLALTLTMLSTSAASAQEPSAPREGIAVHGQWTVTVTRAGKVVERREFENALTFGGMAHLSRVLSRTQSPGKWTILVEADGTGTLCANNEFTLGDDTDCSISESNAEATVTETNSTVVLEGTETVVRAANITLVTTYQWWCTADVTPASCPTQGANRNQFTRRVLDSAIPVQAGDRIEVKVVISFS